MAREHARLLCRIWDDEKFLAQSVGAQRMYMLILSQRLLNHAGVVPMTAQKWANKSPGTTRDDVLRWLEELAGAGFIVMDPVTEEILVRTHIRNDGVYRQPNVLKAALRQALEVESPLLRRALAAELRRLGVESATCVADTLDPNPSGNPSETLPEPFDEPQENPSRRVESTFAQNPGDRGVLKEVLSPSVGTTVLATSSKSPTMVNGSAVEHRPKTRSRSKPKPTTEDFDRFWADYPLKRGKAEAIKAFPKALDLVGLALLVERAQAYAAYCRRVGREPEHILHASTWLNQKRWDDDLDTQPARAAPEDWLREQWRVGRVSEIHEFFTADYTAPQRGTETDFWTETLKPYNQAWITAHKDAILAAKGKS